MASIIKYIYIYNKIKNIFKKKERTQNKITNKQTSTNKYGKELEVKKNRSHVKSSYMISQWKNPCKANDPCGFKCPWKGHPTPCFPVSSNFDIWGREGVSTGFLWISLYECPFSIQSEWIYRSVCGITVQSSELHSGYLSRAFLGMSNDLFAQLAQHSSNGFCLLLSAALKDGNCCLTLEWWLDSLLHHSDSHSRVK